MYTATEQACLRKITDFPGTADSVAEIFLPDSAFAALKTLALTGQAEAILTYFMQRGRETLRLGQYAGLLEVAGVRLEIRPKIGDLATMLRPVCNTPFRTLPTVQVHSQPAQLPLWEVFVSAFLAAVEPLIRTGLQSAFVTVEGNERFIKGRFRPARHLRQNLFHAERIAVAADCRTTNTAPNRLLKTALCHLLPQTTSASNQIRLRRALAAFAVVPASINLAADWQLVRASQQYGSSRSGMSIGQPVTGTPYADALAWAEALLTGQTLGLKPGVRPSLSLLFPMQRVFEEFVAAGFRRYWPGPGVVSTQESSAHLIDNHCEGPTVKLRPDLLIRQPNGVTLVLDTKWKRINGKVGTQPGPGNYGIETADLYQLYAYGKKYTASDLFLIYPAHDTFREPLPVFCYDSDTRLHVVPFDVTKPLADEISQFAARMTTQELTGPILV